MSAKLQVIPRFLISNSLSMRQKSSFSSGLDLKCGVHLPPTTFRRCVARYAGEHKVKSFSCLDQYLSMAFAQLTYRESHRIGPVKTARRFP